MDSIDDRHLDPPEGRLSDPCDGCGCRFPIGDVIRTGTPGDYRWLCQECREKEEREG